jgi:hypothetical protein
MVCHSLLNLNGGGDATKHTTWPTTSNKDKENHSANDKDENDNPKGRQQNQSWYLVIIISIFPSFL